MGGVGEADVVDGDGAEGFRVDAEGVEVEEGFAAEEFAADFVVGAGFALDESDVAAGASEGDGGGCEPARPPPMMTMVTGGGGFVTMVT